MKTLLLALFIAWVAFPSASPPERSLGSVDDAPDSVSLPPDLARVLGDYEVAWRHGDGAALAALFTEDGFVLPNGAPAVGGRDEIRRYYKGPGGKLVLHAFAYETNGSVGYIVGGFSREAGAPDVGKFTLTLRKTGDRWLIRSDMDNGNHH